MTPKSILRIGVPFILLAMVVAPADAKLFELDGFYTISNRASNLPLAAGLYGWSFPSPSYEPCVSGKLMGMGWTFPVRCTAHTWPYDPKNSDAFLWLLVPAGDSKFWIINRASGLPLFQADSNSWEVDVRGFAAMTATALSGLTAYRDSGALWHIEPVGNEFYTINNDKTEHAFVQSEGGNDWGVQGWLDHEEATPPPVYQWKIQKHQKKLISPPQGLMKFDPKKKLAVPKLQSATQPPDTHPPEPDDFMLRSRVRIPFFMMTIQDNEYGYRSPGEQVKKSPYYTLERKDFYQLREGERGWINEYTENCPKGVPLKNSELRQISEKEDKIEQGKGESKTEYAKTSVEVEAENKAYGLKAKMTQEWGWSKTFTKNFSEAHIDKSATYAAVCHATAIWDYMGRYQYRRQDQTPVGEPIDKIVGGKTQAYWP